MKTMTIYTMAFLSFFGMNEVMSQYCTPPPFIDMGGVGEPFTHISRVKLGVLEHTSSLPTGQTGDNGYIYHIDKDNPTLEPGKKYTLEVSVADELGQGVNLAVWIDWNGDEFFDPVEERVFRTVGDGDYEEEITIPNDAEYGKTRMRVYCDMPSNMGHIDPEPCGYLNHPSHTIGQHGEVEDYDVVIGEATGISIVDQKSSTKVYPNPASDFIRLEFDDNTVRTYTAINIHGSVIDAGFLNSKNESIDVSNWNNGQYFIRIQNGKDVEMMKLQILR